MKKIFVIFTIFVLLFVNALACDGVIPIDENTQSTYTDPSYWAIEQNYHELFGMISPEETVRTYGIQTTTSKTVRGFSSTGLIRVKGRAQYCTNENIIVGLTFLDNVSITIYPRYQTIVEEIVTRRTGCAMCARTIASSTMWQVNGTVSHIFYTNQKTFIVGVVYFNSGRDSTALWCGDFDGDGDNELGFKAGVTDFKPTPSPEPTKRPPAKPQVTPKPEPTKPPCAKKECVDVFKLCFKLCIQVKTCFTSTPCKN